MGTFFSQYGFKFLAGIVFGLANVIPGVSGGTMAVVFGFYERLIGLLADFIGFVVGSVFTIFPGWAAYAHWGVWAALLLGLAAILLCNRYSAE